MIYLIYDNHNHIIGYTENETVARAADNNGFTVDTITKELYLSDVTKNMDSRKYLKKVYQDMVDVDYNVNYYNATYDSINGTDRLMFILGIGWKDETLEWLETVAEKAGYPRNIISACGSTSSMDYIN